MRQTALNRLAWPMRWLWFLGAIAGGYGAGTLNLWLSGEPGFGRSIVGALAGAIIAIELFKWRKGIRGSTGLIFVPAFATSVVIGRIGCYLSGIEDNTYGLPTALPWGHDFGDGILRHPVQLYESLSMLFFLAVAFDTAGAAAALLYAKWLLSDGAVLCRAKVCLGVPQALWFPCWALQFIPFHLCGTLLLQYLDDGEA